MRPGGKGLVKGEIWQERDRGLAYVHCVVGIGMELGL